MYFKVKRCAFLCLLAVWIKALLPSFFPPSGFFLPFLEEKHSLVCSCSSKPLTDTHPWVVLPEGLQQAFGFGHLSLTSPCGVRADALPQTKLPRTVKNLPNTVNIM